MDGEKLESILRNIQDFKNLYKEEYEMGFLGKSELERRLSELYTMFDDGLMELGLKRKKPFTNENLARFAEDYSLWAEGGEPNSAIGEPWLLGHSNIWKSDMEATPGEKAAYFQLASEAFIEIRTWELPPDDLEKPERYTVALENKMVVLFDCVDDGGLIACSDPRGREFTLTDSKGLHVVIKVDARAGYEYRPMWEKGSQYHGLIEVEGYTVSGLHSTGTIDITGNKIRSVAYHNEWWVRSNDRYVKNLCTPEEYETASNARRSDDEHFTILTAQGERNEEAFHNYPRWQQYFEWERAHPQKLLSPSREAYICMLLSGKADQAEEKSHSSS